MVPVGESIEAECLMWVKFRPSATPPRTSAPGGEADEIGEKADIAFSNVRCWGVSRRIGGMSQTSESSQ